MTEADQHDARMREFALRELVNDHRAALIIWDWKESVPVEDVSAAAQRGFVHMYIVDDTFSDSYVMIASKVALDPDEVQPLFEMLLSNTERAHAAYWSDKTITNEEYGILVAEAHEEDERQALAAEADDYMSVEEEDD